MAVLDSSAIIEILNESSHCEEILKFEKELISSTAICLNEVLTGYSDQDQLKAVTLFDGLEVLPFDAKAGRRSVDVERNLRKKGKMIQKADIFIAAICLANSLPLITTDKGFKSIEGLEVWLIE